jgi:hypothetical protein
MTLFHLNETTHFDQNSIILTKQWQKKKNQATYCLVLFIFFHLWPEKTARVTIFSKHLILHLFTKFDKR